MTINATQMRLRVFPVTDAFSRPLGYSWEIQVGGGDADPDFYSGLVIRKPPIAATLTLSQEISDTPLQAWQNALAFVEILKASNSFLRSTPLPLPK
jgi:hypothetical protein